MVALTSGGVDSVGKVHSGFDRSPIEGGSRGKAVGTMGVFWGPFADGFMVTRAGERKKGRFAVRLLSPC